ncbi:LOW QUALITY PROTEIN: hypothetical protein HZS_7946 [Henneguya salminicola]|nr:LOW QUALITY PROTEIN: hypothetical protein HZS_7946 [Henneguya salminicola]
MLNLCVNGGKFTINSNIKNNSTKKGTCACPPEFRGNLCQCIYQCHIFSRAHNKRRCYSNKRIDCNGGGISLFVAEECYLSRNLKRCDCNMTGAVGKRCEFKCTEHCFTACCFLNFQNIFICDACGMTRADPYCGIF